MAGCLAIVISAGCASQRQVCRDGASFEEVDYELIPLVRAFPSKQSVRFPGPQRAQTTDCQNHRHCQPLALPLVSVANVCLSAPRLPAHTLPRRQRPTRYVVVLVRTMPCADLIIRTWSRHRRRWSHSWSHPGTFSHVRVGLRGLRSCEAGHDRTRSIRRPQNSKAREMRARSEAREIARTTDQKRSSCTGACLDRDSEGKGGPGCKRRARTPTEGVPPTGGLSFGLSCRRSSAFAGVRVAPSHGGTWTGELA
jgi:hypothetical protein